MAHFYERNEYLHEPIDAAMVNGRFRELEEKAASQLAREGESLFRGLDLSG